MDVPPTKYPVVRATAADVETIAPFFDAYRRFYNQPGDLERASRFLKARLEAAESLVFFCHMEGDRTAPVGFTQLFPIFSSISTASVWILNDLYVAPPFRRNGVARLLLAAAHEHARQSGAISIELATQETNKSAQILYESLGYTEDSGFKRYSLAVGTDPFSDR